MVARAPDVGVVAVDGAPTAELGPLRTPDCEVDNGGKVRLDCREGPCEMMAAAVCDGGFSSVCSESWLTEFGGGC